MNILSFFSHAMFNPLANASYMAKVPGKGWEVYSTYSNQDTSMKV